MQSSSTGARPGTTGGLAELTESEQAQEKLYLIWRSGRLRYPLLLQFWANSLQRLDVEAGPLDYFAWLIRQHPQTRPLCDEPRQAETHPPHT